jgi:hypothetical protein
MTNKQGITATFSNIETELSKTFADIETKFGYKLYFKTRSYDGQENIFLKIEGVKDGSKSIDAQYYETIYIQMGLPPLNTPLKYGEKTYKIVGINKTGTKVKGENAKGLIYLLPSGIVKQLWSLQKNG